MKRLRTVAITAMHVVVILALGGCILPPPVAIDEQENTPPMINFRGTKPARARITLNTNCARCTFDLDVIDPDPEPLYVRAFFNYETNPQPFAFCESPTIEPPETGTERKVLHCNVQPQALLTFNNIGETTSALELWVTDRAFGDGPRTIADGAGFDIARWSVTLEQRGVTCDDREGMGCIGRSGPSGAP